MNISSLVYEPIMNISTLAKRVLISSSVPFCSKPSRFLLRFRVSLSTAGVDPLYALRQPGCQVAALASDQRGNLLR